MVTDTSAAGLSALQRGATLDSCLETLSMQVGPSPIAAHAAKAEAARAADTTCPAVVAEPRKGMKREAPDALPVQTPEMQARYKAYWGQYRHGDVLLRAWGQRMELWTWVWFARSRRAWLRTMELPAAARAMVVPLRQRWASAQSISVTSKWRRG